MDTNTRRAMQTLDRRMSAQYRQAAKTAAQQNRRIFDELANYEAFLNDNMSASERKQAIEQRCREADSRNRFTWAIGGLVIAAGAACMQDIQDTAAQIFSISVNWQVTDVRRQLPAVLRPLAIRRSEQEIRRLLRTFPQSRFTHRALFNLGSKMGLARQDIERRLMSQIVEGMARGENSIGIADRLHNVTRSELYRARRIARTECHRLMSQGRYVAGLECAAAGIPCKKRWISADDERVRHTPFNHETAHFETVEMDADFVKTGEELKYPQDPSGSAGNVINCRCIMVTVVELPSGGSQAYRDLVERAERQTHTH